MGSGVEKEELEIFNLLQQHLLIQDRLKKEFGCEMQINTAEHSKVALSSGTTILVSEICLDRLENCLISEYAFLQSPDIKQNIHHEMLEKGTRYFGTFTPEKDVNLLAGVKYFFGGLAQSDLPINLILNRIDTPKEESSGHKPDGDFANSNRRTPKTKTSIKFIAKPIEDDDSDVPF